MAIEMYVKSRTLTLGDRAGQTAYYATPKQNQHMTNDDLIDHIVQKTSLAKGDVRNAIVSMQEVVKEALQRGSSVDLAELGSLKVVVPSKYMDTPEEVTVSKALKTPKIQFRAKAEMLAAAKSVSVSIDHSYTASSASSSSSSSSDGDGSSSDSGSTSGSGSGSTDGDDKGMD